MEGGDEEQVAVDGIGESEITLYALTGWGSPKTLWVQATINRRQVVMLIDSKSTHNFISEKAAYQLNLKPFSVRVADRNPLRCTGKYQAAAVDLGDITFDIYCPCQDWT